MLIDVEILDDYVSGVLGECFWVRDLGIVDSVVRVVSFLFLLGVRIWCNLCGLVIGWWVICCGVLCGLNDGWIGWVLVLGFLGNGVLIMLMSVWCCILNLELEVGLSFLFKFVFGWKFCGYDCWVVCVRCVLGGDGLWFLVWGGFFFD